MIGVHAVFAMVTAFYAALPAEVVICGSFAFVGIILCGVFGRIS